MFPVCDALLLSYQQSVNFITLANTKGRFYCGSWKNLFCMQTHKCMIRPHNRMFREVKYSTWKQVKASLYMILLSLQKNTWNVVMSHLTCSRMGSLSYAGFYFYSTFCHVLIVLIPIPGSHRSGMCLKVWFADHLSIYTVVRKHYKLVGIFRISAWMAPKMWSDLNLSHFIVIIKNSPS